MGLSAPQNGNSKSFNLALAAPRASLRSILCRANFKNHKSDTQSFDFLSSKSGQFPLLFCSMGHISTLPLHLMWYSISQLSLIFFDAFCQPLPVTFEFSIFLEFLPVNLLRCTSRDNYPTTPTYKEHPQQQHP